MKATRRHGRNRATTTSNGPRAVSSANTSGWRRARTGNGHAAGRVEALDSPEEIAVGRWPVSIAAAALALITACAASPGTAPARRGASREAERVVSQASYRPQGARPASGAPALCGRARSGAEPNGPGTAEMCSELLRVPVRVRQHGRTRIVYRLRPCWCYRDSGSGGG